MIRENVLEDILDTLKFGESILIECRPSYIPEFTVLALTRYARRRNLPVIIDDNLDMLYTIKTNLELFGVKEDFSDVNVIKTGGRIEVGNVIRRISITEAPPTYIQKYKQAAQEAFRDSDKALNIVLGLERLFYFVRDPEEFYTIIVSMQEFLGNKSRKAFYIIDKNVAKRAYINPLPEMERIMSTVIDVEGRGISARLFFKKSAAHSFRGKAVEVTMDEILR
ncbi:DUF257 domain-containing protein [Thermococcus atlanticus]